MFFKWVGWIHLNSELLDFEVISWNILILFSRCQKIIYTKKLENVAAGSSNIHMCANYRVKPLVLLSLGRLVFGAVARKDQH